MIRCFIPCAFLVCSVLASGLALGQDPKVEPRVTPPDAAPMNADPAEVQIKIFRLENVAAKEAETIITQLFGQDLTTIAADERSNQLIVRDDSADTLKEIEAILIKLDESAKKQPPPTDPVPYNPVNPLTPPVAGTAPATMSGPPSRGDMGAMMGMANHGTLTINQVNQAKAQYQTAEKRAAQLATQLQEQSKTDPKDPEVLVLKKQLQNAVADAFAKRQRLHQLELAELEKRVQSVQESLNAREAIRDQIIERRVEELLNPNVNWDSFAKSDPKPEGPITKSQPAPVQGVILGVDPDKKLVEISLGQDDGLTSPAILHVFIGNRHLGRIELMEISAGKSVARILEEQPGVPMRPGDQVTNRWPTLAPMQNSGIQLPGPAQLRELPNRNDAADWSSLGPVVPGMDPMTVQLHIQGPKDAALHLGNGQKHDGPIPARIDVKTGDAFRVPIKNIPGREGLELWPSVEIANNNPAIENFLKHNAIPIEFTAEDLDQYEQGNIVTKAIYLSRSQKGEKATGEVQTLVSTKLDPGVDPVAEARKRGSVLAVVRLVRSISKQES